MSQGSRPTLSAASGYCVFSAASVRGTSANGNGISRSTWKRRSAPSSSGGGVSRASDGISRRCAL